jgi:DNA-binding MarR family transcriptional regulator
LLYRANQNATSLFEAHASQYELTARQFDVLSAISGNEGLSQTQLVAKTAMDRSTFADVTQRLLRKGLIERKRAKQDGRAYAVFLTSLGKHFVKAGDPIADVVDQTILSALSPRRARDFIESLSRVVDALDAAMGSDVVQGDDPV